MHGQWDVDRMHRSERPDYCVPELRHLRRCRITDGLVPIASSTVASSHFLPPGIGSIPCNSGTVANGTGAGTITGVAGIPEAECGGDVGVVVLTIEGDIDYKTAFQKSVGKKHTGETGKRR